MPIKRQGSDKSLPWRRNPLPEQPQPGHVRSGGNTARAPAAAMVRLRSAFTSAAPFRPEGHFAHAVAEDALELEPLGGLPWAAWWPFRICW
ncbi:MAG: hypothetical protein TQ37_09595 [Candidatus Synechococcus spongiarum 15L]|uniref:Uncharacterized protein n=1 Tax=Candidatus Synechococcus spongiarum 15L TaxID=1608419 RepID=A0A0G8ARM1_9SYNE|nr:MAG: hypothetical protein TQ37_09595 [Candidatus Synechococcus spongiarum 15L]